MYRISETTEEDAVQFSLVEDMLGIAEEEDRYSLIASSPRAFTGTSPCDELPLA